MRIVNSQKPLALETEKRADLCVHTAISRRGVGGEKHRGFVTKISSLCEVLLCILIIEADVGRISV